MALSLREKHTLQDGHSGGPDNSGCVCMHVTHTHPPNNIVATVIFTFCILVNVALLTREIVVPNKVHCTIKTLSQKEYAALTASHFPRYLLVYIIIKAETTVTGKSHTNVLSIKAPERWWVFKIVL